MPPVAEGAATGRTTGRDIVKTWFTYHQPSPTQAGKIKAVGETFEECAAAILNNVSIGRDQERLLTQLRETYMNCVGTIVLNGGG